MQRLISIGEDDGKKGLGLFGVAPKEIIFFILSFLNPEELAKLGRVSLIFYHLSNDNILWSGFLSQFNQKEGTTAKKIFLGELGPIKMEYSLFATPGKLDQAEKILKSIKEAEQTYFEINQQNALTLLLEQKISTLKEEKQTPKKMQESLKIFQKLSQINKFFNLLEKNGSMWDFALQSLYQVLINHFKVFGEKALVIIQPECFEQIIDFLKEAYLNNNDNTKNLYATNLVFSLNSDSNNNLLDDGNKFEAIINSDNPAEKLKDTLSEVEDLCGNVTKRQKTLGLL